MLLVQRVSIPHNLVSLSFFINLCGQLSLSWAHFEIPTTSSPAQLQLNDRTPGFGEGALTDYIPTPCRGFVTSKNHHLYLANKLFDFRTFNAPDLTTGTVYQAVDTFRSINGFGSPVTRSYTLRIANDRFGGTTSPSTAHITGWDPVAKDWIYNEKMWLIFDKLLDSASREGTKIIFPIINQDYGNPTTNWVGNYIDLVRHRYGVTDYGQAQLLTDWFMDRPIRKEFKKIIKYLLTRKNTFNGKIYGNDDVFLAFETGNEMNWTEFIPVTNVTSTSLNSSPIANYTLTHIRPAPADWTIDIAKYIKKYAPHTLVMDGSYARNWNVTEAWPEETLRSPYVDLFSYHYYGDGDFQNITQHQKLVESYDKTFIVGEHGFYSNGTILQKFYDTFRGAGSMLWSLRPHSEVSGFAVHGEGNNIFSYHVPGWRNQTSTSFDQREFDVVRITYNASYNILGLRAAKFPLPGPPYPFFASNGSHTGLSFKGAAWAERYEVWGAEVGSPFFTKVADGITDNVDPGELFIAIDPSRPTNSLYLPPPRYVLNTGPQTGWTDVKWATYVTVAWPLPNPPLERRSTITSPEDLDMPLALESGFGESRLQKRWGAPISGGWYCVRGISVDGHPGYFSQPTFIAASDGV